MDTVRFRFSLWPSFQQQTLRYNNHNDDSLELTRDWRGQCIETSGSNVSFRSVDVTISSFLDACIFSSLVTNVSDRRRDDYECRRTDDQQGGRRRVCLGVGGHRFLRFPKTLSNVDYWYFPFNVWSVLSNATDIGKEGSLLCWSDTQRRNYPEMYIIWNRTWSIQSSSSHLTIIKINTKHVYTDEMTSTIEIHNGSLCSPIPSKSVFEISWPIGLRNWVSYSHQSMNL